MNIRLLLAPCLLINAAFAADLPKIPAEPIAEKKDVLFTDDMNGSEHDKRWHKVVNTFVFEKDALKGTQTQVVDTPSKDGKSVVKAHAAVYGLEVPTKDSVVEVNIRFEGCTMIDVEFDDRKYTGSHYGHLCRAQVRLDKVTIMDEREGSQNEIIKALRLDPTKKDEVNKMMAGKSATFPVKLEENKDYTLVVETVGDEMRVSIDGKPVAFLKSAGIGHETKSKIELGVAGQSGWFDGITVWNAAPAKK